MARPVIPVVLPADLRGVENGRLRPAQLVSIEPTGRLHPRAADAWHALKLTAKVDGVILKPTSSADTYRTYLQQRTLFESRYRQVTKLEAIVAKKKGKDVRTWDGKPFVKLDGVASAAVPGTSNHGLGLTVDIADATGKRLAWLEKNAVGFGWSWEFTSGAEPWHVRYYCGDNVPQNVLDVLAIVPRPTV